MELLGGHNCGIQTASEIASIAKRHGVLMKSGLRAEDRRHVVNPRGVTRSMVNNVLKVARLPLEPFKRPRMQMCPLCRGRGKITAWKGASAASRAKGARP
jgi:hypothetical protein